MYLIARWPPSTEETLSDFNLRKMDRWNTPLNKLAFSVMPPAMRARTRPPPANKPFGLPPGKLPPLPAFCSCCANLRNASWLLMKMVGAVDAAVEVFNVSQLYSAELGACRRIIFQRLMFNDFLFLTTVAVSRLGCTCFKSTGHTTRT